MGSAIRSRCVKPLRAYDLNIDLPEPLVPRRLRLPVRERLDARGEVLVPLDESQLESLVPLLQAEGVRSVAIGFLHSYMNGARGSCPRYSVVVSAGLGDHASAEVSLKCEDERISTACANAYVQPLMSQHLRGLERELAQEGVRCPLYLMLSGGGITTLDTAVRFPVRLVESGPAGGAIFASHIARQLNLDDVVSYDMGGTTAKICLIDDGAPQTSRSFEVARVYRFLKGSGIPLRIPVIEMVEIGAGGGSKAYIDALGQMLLGPESAAERPGVLRSRCDRPRSDECCWAVSTGDVAGRMKLDVRKRRSLCDDGPLDLNATDAPWGVGMVDENMAAPAMHAIESGQVVRADPRGV